MQKKIFSLLKLMRLNSPTGYLLLFFPTLFALGTVSRNFFDFTKNIIIFFIGSVVARSIGCIINDICDKDFDSKVQRTSKRPLASGEVTVIDALILLFILSIIGFYILLSLSKISIIIGLSAIPMIIIYPFMKRFTNFPQLFLGLTFNLGALIAYSSVTNYIDIKAILIYLSCFCWTVAYDLVYGFADIKDDKKIGLMSLAIFMENKPKKLLLATLYIAFISIYFFASAKSKYIIITSFIALFMLIWKTYKLDIENRDDCLNHFLFQKYIGIILSLGIVYCNYYRS